MTNFVSELFIELGPHFKNALLLGLLPIILATLLAISFLWAVKSKIELIKGSYSIVISFTALGAMLGVFIGASREPVVGAALPALITLISGLMVYLFSKKEMTKWRGTIPIAIAALVMAASAGGFYGGAARNITEQNEANLSYEREINKNFLSQRLSVIEGLKDICVSTCLKEGGEINICYNECLTEQLKNLKLLERSKNSVLQNITKK